METEHPVGSGGQTKIQHLVTRTITGAVFAGLILVAIFAGSTGLAILFFLVHCLAAFEFFRMFRPQWQWLKISIAVSLTFAPYVLLLINHDQYDQLFAVMSLMIMIVLLITRNAGQLLRQNEAGLILTCLAIIALPLYLGYVIAQSLPELTYRFLYLILAIWCFDVFAYLGGTFFGRHALAKRVSPKKTIEGSFAGAALTLLLAFIFMQTGGKMPPIEALGIAGIVIVFGQTGDLLESLHKREADVKDSGSLLPGHGGVWDRFDSLLGIIPAVFLYYTFVLDLF